MQLWKDWKQIKRDELKFLSWLREKLWNFIVLGEIEKWISTLKMGKVFSSAQQSALFSSTHSFKPKKKTKAQIV